MMIRVSKLTKAFGAKTVLDGVSFSVEKPTLLTGVSGAGKTTLLRILMGLEKPDSGTVQVKGNIAAVFQEDRLIPQLNAEQNICLTAKGEIDREKLMQSLNALELTGEARTTSAAKLSGGQKRRVALLRALLCGANCLLLDEPFTGLDEENLNRAVALTQRLVGNRPCLLVCHDKQVEQALNWERISL